MSFLLSTYNNRSIVASSSQRLTNLARTYRALDLTSATFPLLMLQRNALVQQRDNGRSLPAIGNSDELKSPSTVLDASNPSLQAPSRLPNTMSNEKSSPGGHDWKLRSLGRSSTQIGSLPQYLDPFIGPGSQSLPTNHKHSHLRVEASGFSVSYQRDRLCLCQCHQAMTMTSPGEWSNVLGRLFVGYTGLPLPAKKCDRTSCQHGQVQPRIRVAYLFPLWFAWKMFALTVPERYESVNKFHVEARFPRRDPG